MTCINCSNCNKELKRGEKEIAEKQGHGECAECQFHEANGTRTIEQFNKWLRSPMRHFPGRHDHVEERRKRQI